MHVHNCSRNIWFHALTEVAGKEQISLTKPQKAVFLLLLSVVVLFRSPTKQGTKQLNSFFPHLLWETELGTYAYAAVV